MNFKNQLQIAGLLIAAAAFLALGACGKKPAGGEKSKAGTKMSAAGLSGADLDKAKAVYAKTCESCHGKTGMGDGPAGKAIKARNFKDTASYKQGSSEADVLKSINSGVPGTAMVGYEKAIPENRKLKPSN